MLYRGYKVPRLSGRLQKTGLLDELKRKASSPDMNPKQVASVVQTWNIECFRDIRLEKKATMEKIKEVDLKEESGNINEINFERGNFFEAKS